jgi:hypothetical protein
MDLAFITDSLSFIGIMESEKLSIILLKLYRIKLHRQIKNEVLSHIDHLDCIKHNFLVKYDYNISWSPNICIPPFSSDDVVLTTKIYNLT